MTIKSAPFYWVECDCCEKRADYGDYAAWSSSSEALDQIEHLDWMFVSGEALCHDCWMWPPDDADSDDPIRAHVMHPAPNHTNGSTTDA